MFLRKQKLVLARKLEQHLATRNLPIRWDEELSLSLRRRAKGLEIETAHPEIRVEQQRSRSYDSDEVLNPRAEESEAGELLDFKCSWRGDEVGRAPAGEDGGVVLHFCETVVIVAVLSSITSHPHIRAELLSGLNRRPSTEFSNLSSVRTAD